MVCSLGRDLRSALVMQQESAVEADSNVMEVKDLVEAIVKSMVDQPEKVICREVQGTHSCVLELEVAIGRKGIHADAIRRIVHAAGGKRKMRYVLEIIEDR